MPTTTNNGWPTPADTDLVKNGADAIRDLGQAIDTTLGVYSAVTPGSVKISTTTFSGVATQSFNNVFSTTYDNYKILVKITGSTSTALNFRLRVSGTDTSTNYYWAGNYQRYDQTTESGENGNNVAQGQIGGLQSVRGFHVVEINQPFLATPTQYSSLGFDAEYKRHYAGAQSGSTSFDGITLIALSGTMTGTVSVYGYNK
mgnify:CR=1 FL=1